MFFAEFHSPQKWEQASKWWCSYLRKSQLFIPTRYYCLAWFTHSEAAWFMKKKMVCIPHKSFSTSKVSLFLTTPYFMLLRAHDHTNWNSHTTLGVSEKHQPQTHCQEPSEILEKLWKTREVIHRECYWRIKLEVQLNHASGWLNLGRTVLKLLRSEQVNLVTTYPVVELPFDIFAKILVTSPFRAVLSITFATNP